MTGVTTHKGLTSREGISAGDGVSVHDGVSESVGEFTPFSLPNLNLWLDASDEATISDTSGNVDSWADKSGNSNDADKVSDITRPLTGSDTLNGLNVLTWDSTARRLLIAEDSSLDFGSTGYFVALVAQFDVLNSFDVLYSRWSGPGTREFSLIKRNNGPPANTFYGTYSTDGTDSVVFGNTESLAINTPYVLWMNYDVGGDLTTGVGTATPDTTSNSVTIYERPGGLNTMIGDELGGGAPHEGLIAEVINYQRNLSMEEIDQIGQYLSTKWGASWS